MQNVIKTSAMTILWAILLLTFLIIEVYGAAYEDVNQKEWYYDEVAEMTDKGLLKGYPDSTFRPNNTITKAEFVTVITRIINIQGKGAQNSHWAGENMQAALDAQLYDWDEIPPTGETYDMPITRELAVKVLMKAVAPGIHGDYNAEKAKIADFEELSGRYYDVVIAAYSTGVLKGDNKGNFNPKAFITRAEACAILSRAMDKFPSTVATLPGSNSNDKANAGESAGADGSNKGKGKVAAGGVAENGKLEVVGTKLKNQKGETVVLRGMSSHGIQWFPQFVAKDAIGATAARGANLFRVAMYTDENGYIANPKVKETLIQAVDNAISLNMYVIIDWHILFDGNPNTYKNEAKAFFSEMAERYRGNPAVIYEICNEPNGAVTWGGDVKPYAEEVINIIREKDAEAIILVGSPTWSQDLHEVAGNPINEKNIMYTCHFYAGTHTQWLRDRVADALKKNIPVFVSEWGVSDATGGGGVFREETEKWMRFLNENGISWANWSLCDKGESAAALKSNVVFSDGLDDSELTESGRIVFHYFENDGTYRN